MSEPCKHEKFHIDLPDPTVGLLGYEFECASCGAVTYDFDIDADVDEVWGVAYERPVPIWEEASNS